MRRAVHTLVALAVAALLAAPADSAPPPVTATIRDDGAYVYQIVRTSSAPRRLVMEVDAKAYDDRGDLFMVGLVGTGRNRKIEEETTSVGYLPVGMGTAWPVIHGPGSTLPRCPDAPTCRWPVPAGQFVKIDSQQPMQLTYLVGSFYTEAKITVTSPGWRIQRTNLGLRRLQAEDVADAGVRFGATTIERFTNAELPGGRYGSSVFASIPCSRHGVGEATLTGGPEPVRVWCRDDPLWQTRFADYADTFRPTRWRLHGDVTGYGATITRLAVMDFPKG